MFSTYPSISGTVLSNCLTIWILSSWFEGDSVPVMLGRPRATQMIRTSTKMESRHQCWRLRRTPEKWTNLNFTIVRERSISGSTPAAAMFGVSLDSLCPPEYNVMGGYPSFSKNSRIKFSSFQYFSADPGITLLTPSKYHKTIKAWKFGYGSAIFGIFEKKILEKEVLLNRVLR